MKKEGQVVTRDNSFGVVSVILGIIGIALSSFHGFLLGIVGIFFSLQQKKRYPNSWSKAGFILNIISIILGIASIILFILVLRGVISSPALSGI